MIKSLRDDELSMEDAAFGSGDPTPKVQLSCRCADGVDYANCAPTPGSWRSFKMFGTKASFQIFKFVGRGSLQLMTLPSIYRSCHADYYLQEHSPVSNQHGIRFIGIYRYPVCAESFSRRRKPDPLLQFLSELHLPLAAACIFNLGPLSRTLIEPTWPATNQAPSVATHNLAFSP